MNKAQKHISLKLFISSALLIIITMGIFGVIYSDWLQNPRIPISYDYDTVGLLALIKDYAKTNSYNVNMNMGLPSGLVFFDYPQNDTFGYGVLKILMVATNDPNLSLNMAYFFGFILVSLTSYYFLYFYSRNIFLSFCGALSYSFATYHLIHGAHHLFLSFYFTVPIAIHIYLQLISGLYTRRSFLFLILCSLVIGINGFYYSYFTVIILLLGLIQSTGMKQIYRYIFIVTTLAFLAFLHYYPTLSYQLANGVNKAVTYRDPMDSVNLGLNIIRLFVPIFSGFRTQGTDLLLRLTHPHEGGEYLGLLGMVGLVATSYRFIRGNIERHSLESRLGILSLFIILFTTTTGLSIFISLFISPLIRAYVRMSPFLTLLSILLCILFFKRVLASYQRSVVFVRVGILLITIISIYLQIGPVLNGWQYASFAVINDKVMRDRAYMQLVEGGLKKGAWIMQLPYMQFPEALPVYKIGTYHLFYPYLASRDLKFSFGAMKGRESDYWQSAISKLPLDYQLYLITLAGFDGLLVDKYGYKNPDPLIALIEVELGGKSIKDTGGRYEFFSLDPKKLKKLMTKKLAFDNRAGEELNLDPAFLNTIHSISAKIGNLKKGEGL